MDDTFEVILDSELKDGELRQIKSPGHDVLIAKVGGEYYALGNICTHRGCYLSSGWIDGRSVVCGCHMSKFDVRDGKVVNGPASKPQTVYEVKVDGNKASLRIKSTS
ncbi:MAG: Rieske (2Fe-2S) protein [Thaumarchaeota archaeon]|nr:Rieske (2Fe-2S) protein [Nitrososphaerota archaeon]